MQLPQDPTSGGPIIIWARQVQAFLRSLQPQEGPSTRPRWGTSGVAWEIKSVRTPDAPVKLPWEPYTAPAVGEGSDSDGRKIRIRPGTVSGRFVSNREEVFTIPASVEEYYGWLEITYPAEGFPFEAVCVMGDTIPASSPPTDESLPVGEVAGVLRQPLFKVSSSEDGWSLEEQYLSRSVYFSVQLVSWTATGASKTVELR